jgi:hypothetical protein
MSLGDIFVLDMEEKASLYSYSIVDGFIGRLPSSTMKGKV